MMVRDQDVEEKKDNTSFMSSARTQEEELDWEMPKTMLGTEAQFRESQALEMAAEQVQDEKLGDKDPLQSLGSLDCEDVRTESPPAFKFAFATRCQRRRSKVLLLPASVQLGEAEAESERGSDSGPDPDTGAR
ncbi:C4b-binding protein alpha chain-like [Platysternon megacephalum]|uniref:C4b-binding protein alpha chain-like n=1 Tax=Platysternon megacephalum TaxID=55544 RepID=A0A4D9EFV6_9SAUR|nr:C4b-binding protein alpha chain-like [Platysternon megacephalum]